MLCAQLRYTGTSTGVGTQDVAGVISPVLSPYKVTERGVEKGLAVSGQGLVVLSMLCGSGERMGALAAQEGDLPQCCGSPGLDHKGPVK